MPTRAGAAEADDPEPVQAGDEEQPAPHDGDQHGLAEIGLQDQRHDGGRQKQERQERARHVALAGALGEGPGGEHHEGGLDELGGLQADAGDRDPAMRALDLRPPLQRRGDERHPDHVGEKREAPDVAQRQERHRDHQRDGGREVEHLPADEMEGREPEPLGDRRAAGHQEHEARDHENDEAGKRRAIDGPPPIADEAPFRARHHGVSPFLASGSSRKPRSGYPGSAATRAAAWVPALRSASAGTTAR